MNSFEIYFTIYINSIIHILSIVYILYLLYICIFCIFHIFGIFIYIYILNILYFIYIEYFIYFYILYILYIFIFCIFYLFLVIKNGTGFVSGPTIAAYAPPLKRNLAPGHPPDFPRSTNKYGCRKKSRLSRLH